MAGLLLLTSLRGYGTGLFGMGVVTGMLWSYLLVGAALGLILMLAPRERFASGSLDSKEDQVDER